MEQEYKWWLGGSAGLNKGKVIKAVSERVRGQPLEVSCLHAWPILKTRRGNEKGNGRIKGSGCVMGWATCRWQADIEEALTGLPWYSGGERPRLILQQRYGSWQVVGRRGGGGGIPAGDESNNSDMTPPKMKLALLWDDVSGFQHLAVQLQMQRLV